MWHSQQSAQKFVTNKSKVVMTAATSSLVVSFPCISAFATSSIPLVQTTQQVTGFVLPSHIMHTRSPVTTSSFSSSSNKWRTHGSTNNMKNTNLWPQKLSTSYDTTMFGSRRQTLSSVRNNSSPRQPLFDEELNIIYDSKCSVCKLEIDWLSQRDQRLNHPKPKLKMTDLESDDYQPDKPANGGVTYEQGMGAIHAVTSDGTVLKGVPVFQAAYDKVGLGWLFAVTRLPLLNKLVEAMYNVFAKYRTNLTRGSSLHELVQSYKERKEVEEAAAKKKQDCDECQRITS